MGLAYAIALLACASFDEFEGGPRGFTLTAEPLTLTLEGDIELELHDLEGEGGPGYDSPTDTRTIGTRSPFVELDTVALSLRVGLGEQVSIHTVLEFTTEAARARAILLEANITGPEWLEHHIEVGYDAPIVRIDRRSERYPLAATIHWRSPELHAAWEGRFRVAEHVSVELGASIAMMRPLGFVGVQDSTAQPTTISVLAAEGADTFSGNGPVGGGRARVTLWGFSLEGFGFVGQLAAEGGTDVLRSGFSNYRELPGYRDETNTTGDYWWAGGRVAYEGYGVYALAEAVFSREDLLRRWAVYGQVAYHAVLHDGRLFRSLEPLVRWDSYRITDSDRVGEGGRALRSTAPINAVSWDFDVLTLAASTEVWGDWVRLRVEYAFIWESNGVQSLGVADDPFRNNELLVQAELRF